MASSSGFGLEEIGIPGRDYLREALTSCTDPLKAIEDFQIENGILLPSLRPMLPLLDLHGIKRLDFHNSVLEDLREKLVTQIEEVNKQSDKSENPKEKERKLKELLVKSFPVIKIKQLRPVVMSVLKHLSFIEDKYLRVLVRDKELYQDCDIVVKRHLWRDNQSLFGDEVSPFLSQYIRDKERVLYLNDIPLQDESSGSPGSMLAIGGFFGSSPKARRQGVVIQKLAQMIGSNVKLYDMTLQFLRTLFLRTRNVHYCTLRAELLMALHDLEVQEIISVDPCHKFTWCLDACIREKNVDVKRSRELQGFLDAVRRGQEQVLGDLSMTLCDPYAINFLVSAAMKILNHQVSNDQLPRDNNTLHLLLRMLSLGLSAWTMIDSQEFNETRIQPEIVTKFIPALLTLIVDDQYRALNAKLPPEERETAMIVIDHAGPPPDAFQSFIETNQVAATLAMQYTLQVARAKDKTGLNRVLGILAPAVKGHPFEDVFLHCLITQLIQMKDEFTKEDFCTVIFDEFFFSFLGNDNILRHLLRLIWFVYPKLTQIRVENLMKLTEPSTASVALSASTTTASLLASTAASEQITKLHQELLEKISASVSNTSQTEETQEPFI